MARLFAISLLGLMLFGSGCNLDADEFVCSLDTECPASSGGYGKCVVGHCAFRNSSCPSGWIYDETGGPVADQCVPPEDLTPDAGAPQVDAGPTPDAGPISDAGPVPDAGPTLDGAVADAGTPDA